MADRVKENSTGADLYLVKLVDIEELAAAVLSIVAHTTLSQTATPPCWLLERTTWGLIAPDGRDFRLSQKSIASWWNWPPPKGRQHQKRPSLMLSITPL